MEDVYKLVLWDEVVHTKMRSFSVNFQSETSIPMVPTNGTVAVSGKEGEKTKVSFFSVCDGHGGRQAAEFVNSSLFQLIVSQPDFLTNPREATLNGFAQVEQSFSELVKERNLDGMIGTTVTSAMLLGNKLIIANLGDSEAVLCSEGKAKVITECHSTNNVLERQRVEASGGLLVTDRVGNHRLGHPLWNPYYVNIAVTRSIGDFFFKHHEYVGTANSGLISIPSISVIEITHDDMFLILASDGFWDTVTYTEAVECVLSKMNLDCETVCQDLVKLSKTSEEADNVTVMLVKLK